jgi:hypothetical protein
VPNKTQEARGGQGEKMNKMALILLAAVVATGAAAGAANFSTLATITYTINQVTSQSSTQPQVILNTANLNLGNLTPGQLGTASANTTMTVNTSGNYTFELNENPIESVFSSFNVTIIVGNKILYLTEGQNDVHTYLSNGTYQVQIKVSYQVSQNPEGNGVQDKPLIIVKPYQGDNSPDMNSNTSSGGTSASDNSPDHSTNSSQGDNNSGSSDSGYGDNNSGSSDSGYGSDN